LLQDPTDNRLYKFPTERGKGVVGTILFHVVVIALLLVSGFTSKPAVVEEGLLVNFGTDDFGSGLVEPSLSTATATASASESAPLPQPTTPVATPTQEKPIDTQEFDDEAPVVKKVVEPDPEAEKKKLEAAEAEKKRLADLEAERKRVEQEEIERKRIEEEKRREQEIADRMKNALATGRNTGTSTTGEGVTTGSGNQGVVTGSVDSRVRGDGSGLGTDGVGYDLAGRKALSLPHPKYEIQEEGIVVVEVTVDRTGKVVSAREGVRGSTTLNADLRKVARDAALLARFDVKNDAPNVQVGTITYHFKLR
jgi:outer membrane biosynthesis protein TonB